MISTAPLTAAKDLGTVAEKVRAFVTIAKAKAADGLTVSEFAELVTALLRVVVAAVDSLPDTNDEKKQWCLDAVAMLFDAVADKCVPTIAWPIWLVVRGSVRSLVLMAAAGAIESILPLVRMSAQ